MIESAVFCHSTAKSRLNAPFRFAHHSSLIQFCGAAPMCVLLLINEGCFGDTETLSISLQVVSWTRLWSRHTYSCH